MPLKYIGNGVITKMSLNPETNPKPNALKLNGQIEFIESDGK